MLEDEIIDINGGWTSQDGKYKIDIKQKYDKFEGFVGDQDEIEISLGTISGRTLNFKQTWHRGRNKGAVATVYGRLTTDNSTILLEFEGMRSNGRGMKGKNAIFRENLIGTWTPASLNGRGDIWYFGMKKNGDIAGYHDTKLKDRILLRGKRSQEDANFFTISMQWENGRWNAANIKGEYRCPGIVLTIGDRNVVLRRKRQETMPTFKEYDILPISRMESESVLIFCLDDTSFTPTKRPFRIQSNEPEDLRTRLLPPASVHSDKKTRKRCCWCI